MSLRKYVLKRLLLAFPVLIGVSALTFLLVHLVPGDPVDTILGFQEADPELREAIRAEYNLDRPVWEQYALWLGNALALDFGQSPLTGQDVGSTVAGRLPHTLALGLSAWLLALAIGIPAGVASAVHAGRPTDDVSRFAALAGIATPNFWLGLVLLSLFSVQLGWVPVLPPDAPLLSLETARFLILPTITLAAASAALIARLMRASMLRELEADYVRTARAKGLPERTVIGKHVLRNSLVAVLTVAGLQLAFLVDGAVVVEAVFSWPGLGQLLVGAIFERDIPVIQAGVLLIGTSVVLANILVDLLYGVLDPRVSHGENR